VGQLGGSRGVTALAVPLLIALALVGAGPAPAAFGQTDGAPSVEPGRVEPVDDSVPGQYIVTLDSPGAQASSIAADLTADYGGEVLQTFTSALSGFAVRMSPDEALALSTSPLVTSVAEDAYVHATADQVPVPSWGLDRIDQRALPLNGAYHYDADGTGVTAYVIDSGMRFTHTDFGNRASLGIDLVGGVGRDCDGHGTHVAGTLGGAEYGVAKNVSLVAVRVLDCAGEGLVSAAIAGIDWVTEHHHSPAVANISFGATARVSALDTAVRNSIASGVTYAIAAGNDAGDACNFSPGATAEALTVGATDAGDRRPSFSNFGSCVDLFAPGVGITSDWATGDSATSTISGTSMAAPHVAGAAALYLQASPDASPTQVAAALTANASPNQIVGLPAGTANLLAYESFISANHISRIWGSDAIATSIATSQAGFPANGSAGAVVLARSDFFSDALAGGPLAAAQDGPLLISPGASAASALDPRVRTEILRVLPTGGRVYALGGPLALAPGVEAELAGLDYSVTRLAGPNQFATAVAIAEALGDPPVVFEATGLGFADALSAVPAAIQAGAAILLTSGATQAPETAAYLSAHPPETRYAIGGPLAAAGADPSAIAVFDQDLFGTSAAVALEFFPHPTVFGIATGMNYPDALSGGVFIATGGRLGPMLLVRPHAPLPTEIDFFLATSAPGAFGTIFGGSLAVAEDVISVVTFAIGT